jgi:hypothetical protein
MKRTSMLILGLGLSLLAQSAQAAWTKSQRLTWTSGDSHFPAIAVDPSGSLHVVWYDNTPGNYEIFYKKSADGGATWTASRRLSWTPANSYNPAIAIDSSGRIHIVWLDYPMGSAEICYTRSTDGGATWAKMHRLTWTSGDSDDPDVGAGASGVHVVWSDLTPGNWEIYYKKSLDGGATWGASRRLTATSGHFFGPVIAVDPSGNPHIAWWGDPAGNPEIYYKKSTNGGAAWTANQRLTWTSSGSYVPAIAVDSSAYLHVVWHDYGPGFPDIYHRKSTNGGTTWAKTQRLTWTASYSMAPAIAAGSSGSLHLVWYDTTPGNNEIYYKKSLDWGATWAADQRLTWTSGDSEDPDIVVGPSGNVHVVWADETPGNSEIYYRRGQ